MASTLLTTAQVQAQLETDLPDDELETLIDEADGLIVLRYGAHSGEVTDDYSPVRELVFLRRQAQSIAEIKTRYAYQLWAAATVADAPRPTSSRTMAGYSAAPRSAGSTRCRCGTRRLIPFRSGAGCCWTW